MLLVYRSSGCAWLALQILVFNRRFNISTSAAIRNWRKEKIQFACLSIAIRTQNCCFTLPANPVWLTSQHVMNEWGRASDIYVTKRKHLKNGLYKICVQAYNRSKHWYSTKNNSAYDSRYMYSGTQPIKLSSLWWTFTWILLHIVYQNLWNPHSLISNGNPCCRSYSTEFCIIDI